MQAHIVELSSELVCLKPGQMRWDSWVSSWLWGGGGEQWFTVEPCLAYSVWSQEDILVSPVSLHPLLSIHIPYKMEPTARGGTHLQPLTLSC